MRRVVLALFLVALLVVVARYAWRAPERAFEELRRALVTGDEAELEERIDFPALRESLKRELLELITAASPGGDIALAQSRFVGTLVDALVTRERLFALGGEADKGDAVVRWRGSSGFVVERPAPEGGLHRLTFERRGLSFVLVGIELAGGIARELAERAALRSTTSAVDLAAVGEQAARACAAWRKLAQHDLQAIGSAERAFRASHGRYTATVEELAFTRPPGPDVYEYVVTAREPRLVLEARGKGVMTGDLLRYDDGVIALVEDRCSR